MPARSNKRYQQLIGLRDRVFGEWLNAVREHIQHAHKLPDALLIDTLPIFYERLCAAIAGMQRGYDQSTLASEHGGERARLTRYDVEMVAHEFQMFRVALLRVWDEAGIALELRELMRANTMIDEAIRESISGFVLTEAAARQQFFAALAHDIRTPLSTAAMAVDMIAQGPDPETVKQLAELAARQHERIATMVAELLDQTAMSSAQRGVLELQSFDLAALVHEVIGCSTLASARNIDLKAEPVHGYWHRESLRRAIENLLNNALKYSDPGTTIGVQLLAYGGRVTFIVTNEGPSIPPDQFEAIFQLFRRVASKGEQGWGIGLPYVRAVAEQHGGSITLESGERRTAFMFDIPTDPRPLLAARSTT